MFEYFYKAFIEPWETVIVSIQAGGDHATAGFILAAILIILWAIFFYLLKLIIWNVVFPKIRLIDQYGNRIRTARVYFHARALKPNITDCLKGTRKEYYWGKFRLLPIIQFHRVMVDKGKFRLRRMPWTIDVFTDGLNLKWDTKERCYVVDDGQLVSQFDEKQPYIDDALEGIKTVGDLVVEGVKGDFGLIKKKFKLGLSVKRLSDHNAEKDTEDEYGTSPDK
jgi:hypothetical protein